MDLPIIQTDISRFQGDVQDQVLTVTRNNLPVDISNLPFIFTVGDPGNILGELRWTPLPGSTNGNTILTIPALITGLPVGRYFYTLKYSTPLTVPIRVITFMAGNLIIYLHNNPLSI